LASIRLQEEPEKIKRVKERNKDARMSDALNDSPKFCNSDKPPNLEV